VAHDVLFAVLGEGILDLFSKLALGIYIHHKWQLVQLLNNLRQRLAGNFL